MHRARRDAANLCSDKQERIFPLRGSCWVRSASAAPAKLTRFARWTCPSDPELLISASPKRAARVRAAAISIKLCIYTCNDKLILCQMKTISVLFGVLMNRRRTGAPGSSTVRVEWDQQRFDGTLGGFFPTRHQSLFWWLEFWEGPGQNHKRSFCPKKRKLAFYVQGYAWTLGFLVSRQGQRNPTILIKLHQSVRSGNNNHILALCEACTCTGQFCRSHWYHLCRMIRQHLLIRCKLSLETQEEIHSFREIQLVRAGKRPTRDFCLKSHKTMSLSEIHDFGGSGFITRDDLSSTSFTVWPQNLIHISPHKVFCTHASAAAVRTKQTLQTKTGLTFPKRQKVMKFGECFKCRTYSKTLRFGFKSSACQRKTFSKQSNQIF